MKQYILPLAITLVSVLLFNSCSTDDASMNENSIINSTLKSEVEKLVDLHCKAINVLRKVDKGDRTALNRSNAIRKEADKVSFELKKKYSSPEGQEEFSKAYQEALANCPYDH